MRNMVNRKMKFLYILTNLDSHSIQRYIANLVNDKNIFNDQ